MKKQSGMKCCILSFNGFVLGVLPRFQTELVLKVYNKQNTAFTYTYKFSTTHKAVMEQKLQNNVISNRWWDSMSNVQQGNRVGQYPTKFPACMSTRFKKYIYISVIF